MKRIKAHGQANGNLLLIEKLPEISRFLGASDSSIHFLKKELREKIDPGFDCVYFILHEYRQRMAERATLSRFLEILRTCDLSDLADEIDLEFIQVQPSTSKLLIYIPHKFYKCNFWWQGDILVPSEDTVEGCDPRSISEIHNLLSNRIEDQETRPSKTKRLVDISETQQNIRLGKILTLNVVVLTIVVLRLILYTLNYFTLYVGSF